MKPVTPVVPGHDLPLTLLAKEGYLNLPAHVDEDGMLTARWTMTWKERLRVLLSGHVWLQIVTTGRGVQPHRILADCPEVKP